MEDFWAILLTLRMVLGSLNNCDFALFHLKVVAKQPSHPLHAKLDRLIREIKIVLTTTQNILLKQLIERKLGEIFEFRLDTLRWMSMENLDFQGMLHNEVAPFLDNMSKVSSFQAMISPIMLALSVMEVVVEKIFSSLNGIYLIHRVFQLKISQRLH